MAAQETELLVFKRESGSGSMHEIVLGLRSFMLDLMLQSSSYHRCYAVIRRHLRLHIVQPYITYTPPLGI